MFLRIEVMHSMLAERDPLFAAEFAEKMRLAEEGMTAAVEDRLTSEQEELQDREAEFLLQYLAKYEGTKQ